MNWVKNIFSGVEGFFKRLFPDGTTSYIKVLEDISKPVSLVYPFVKKIAELTPNKTDDEILAAYEHFGLAKLFSTEVDKNVALRDLVKNLLIRTQSSVGPLPSHLINLAIEFAYAKLKQEKV